MPLKEQRASLRATWIICFFLGGGAWAHSQGNVFRFEHLTIVDGLSESAVTKILQDRKGFMWFATQDGLDRYDGHNLRIFRHDPSDSSSLADSYVSTLLEDSRGNLWVGTNGGGLDRFDARTESFTHFGDSLARGEFGEKRSVGAIAEDSAHQLWIGRTGRGLARFDPAAGSFRRFINVPDDSSSLSDNNIWALIVDRGGSLWAGTYNGINRYDPGSDSFEKFNVRVPHTAAGETYTAAFETAGGTLLFAHWGYGLLAFDRTHRRFVPWELPGADGYGGAEKYVWSFAESRSGELWIGTNAGGLLLYDGRATRQFIKEPDDANSLSAEIVSTLCVDRSGSLWAGTPGAGVNKYSAGYRGFSLYRHFARDKNSIADNNIWAFLEDRAGNLWVSSTGGGIDVLSREGRLVRHYAAGLPGSAGLTSNAIVCLCEDADGSIWAGSRDAGLFRLDRGKGSFSQFISKREDPSTIGSNAVNSLFLDSTGALWAGTYYGGLSRFERRTGKFSRFLNDPADLRTLADNTVFPLLQSRRGGMWVGLMGGGLDLYRDGTFTHHRYDPQNPASLSDNRVLCLMEDHAGILWIGTMGGGLNRFDESAGTFTRFSEKEGLPNSTIYGVLEDGLGKIWVSTNRGIARLDPATGNVRMYDENDGLQSNEFNAGAYLKSRSGEMLFGGINGFNRFHPDSTRENAATPQVVITSFSVLGSPARFRNELSGGDAIRLTHNDNFFSFAFAALDYANPRKNQYAYMIEGFDRSWIRSGNGHTATYTNVDPGEYTLRVAASNNDGIWNWDGATIRLIITPPLWKTWWAYLLYAVGITGVVAGIVRFRTISQSRALRQKELKLREQEEHEKQISSSLREKEVLLKEVHHRVKNNLQVISSLLNIQAYQTQDPAVRTLFRETQDRVRSMALVHEKLYRSKDMARINFGEYLSTVTSELMRSGHRAGITSTVDAENVLMGVDTAIPCGLIVNELVSNALKHAFHGRDTGTVAVALKRRDAHTLELIVADDGIGFPPDLDFRTLSSMGMNIVNTLAVQISGEVTLDRTAGTKYIITFPG